MPETTVLFIKSSTMHPVSRLELQLGASDVLDLRQSEYELKPSLYICV